MSEAFRRADKNIIVAVVALAIYGDLIKRFVPAAVALGAQYSCAGAILVYMLYYGRPRTRFKTGDLGVGVILCLISAYILQLLTNVYSFDLNAISETLYMVIPLLFIVVIQKTFQQFDIVYMSKLLVYFMIPVHAVGLVQFFIDPSFLVSFEYSDSGGVIMRNYMDKIGSFSRYPSIFSSADRYSGVSMVSCVLLIVPLLSPRKITGVWFWAGIGIASSLVGLLIGGARSRFVIVAISVLAAFWPSISRSTVLVLILGTAIIAVAESQFDLSAFPVLGMLQSTYESGDIWLRLEEGISNSLPPDNVTIFGEGLGIDNEGRPGEFAIRAMWIEGGTFWTSIMIVLNIAVIYIFFVQYLQAIVRRDTPTALISALASLCWIFAVLAGLSSTFELSQALILCPAIATLWLDKFRQQAFVASGVSTRQVDRRRAMDVP